MGETTSQIETRIEQTREDLGSNLRELETRVKSAADWREHFRTNPLVWLGLAFGGGVFLGTLTGRRDPLEPMESYDASAAGASASRASDRARRQVLDAWDEIKSALVGVATARVMSFLGEAIAGFEDQRRPGGTNTASPFQGRQNAARTAGSSGF